MDQASTTIKIHKDYDGLFRRQWAEAHEAASDINRSAAEGRPVKAYNYSSRTPWGDEGPPTFVGYYVRAEVTDIGELWVRLFKTDNPNLGNAFQQTPYWREREQELIRRAPFARYLYCPFVPLQ